MAAWLHPVVTIGFALFCAARFAAAEPPAVQPGELPRFAPLEPEQARAAFEIKPGFEVQLVAAEPLVSSPIAVCFDEDARMYVLEMRDYPEARDAEPPLGRVVRLEDRDGDGRCETRTIFAENLAWPTGLIWASGGLFVVSVPDVLFFPDADRDGRADSRDVVFTGFNSGAPKLNVQALPNSFAWGPDHRIHLQTGGGNRGVIRCLSRPELAPQELGGRDFWFDPRSRNFGFESGGGQYGMSFDDAGRRFTCNNSDHLRVHLFDDRYAARNPHTQPLSPLASIAADGPAAEVFRISPDEPWRRIRTRWRVAGQVPGPVEGGGRVSGYFTGATGVTIYRGDALGPEYVGNAFVGDAGGNLVHRKVVRPQGVSFVGERPPDEKTREFLASPDTWFRPVSFANAPDGTLYVVDMYREVIEHPWSLPEQIKQHLDLTSGRDRGRVWRIAPQKSVPRRSTRLRAGTLDELVAALEHPNGWHRETATRLLCERRDPAAAGKLEGLLRHSAAPLARLHALRALDGVEALTASAVLRGLSDADPRVRESALKLSEKLSPADAASAEVQRAQVQMAHDPVERVRLQAAFTLGGSVDGEAIEALAHLARHEFGNRWMVGAILSAVPDALTQLSAKLRADASFSESAEGKEFLGRTAAAAGATRRAGSVNPKLPPADAERLRESREMLLAAASVSAASPTARSARDAVIERFASALALTGDAAKGRALYTQRCALCHRLRGEGHPFGPDLEGVVNGGKEKLLTHILDPNREVAPQFGAVVVELKDGAPLAGIIVSETSVGVTLREPLGQEHTVSRDRVARVEATGRSPMPEGIEAGLSAQDMADLLEFIITGKR